MTAYESIPVVPQGAAPVQWTATVPAELSELARLDARIMEWLEEVLEGEHLRKAIHLAVHEACTNVLLHAYTGGKAPPSGRRALRIALRKFSTTLAAAVTDWGHGFDFDTRMRVLERTGPDLHAERGRGLHIINSTMDVVTYLRSKDAYTLVMAKYLPAYPQEVDDRGAESRYQY